MRSSFRYATLLCCMIMRSVYCQPIPIPIPADTTIYTCSDNEIVKLLDVDSLPEYWLDDNAPKVLKAVCKKKRLTNLEARCFFRRTDNVVFDVKELQLSHNLLATLDDNSFSMLENLEKLDLSDNRLTIIKEAAFTGLANLGALYLHDNLIAAVKAPLHELPVLLHVNLSDNDLFILEEDAFGEVMLRLGFTLTLTENELSCDCEHLQWLFAVDVVAHVTMSDMRRCRDDEMRRQLMCKLTKDACEFDNMYLGQHCEGAPFNIYGLGIKLMYVMAVLGVGYLAYTFYAKQCTPKRVKPPKAEPSRPYRKQLNPEETAMASTERSAQANSQVQGAKNPYNPEPLEGVDSTHDIPYRPSPKAPPPQMPRNAYDSGLMQLYMMMQPLLDIHDELV